MRQLIILRPDMLRVLTYFFLCLFSCLVSAKKNPPLFQVDMIVFTHLKASTAPVEHEKALRLPPNMSHAVPLQNTVSKTMTPYHLLPSSSSQLRDEYWALNHKPQYQILFHYTWLQPGNNKQALALSQTNTAGWNVEGTLQIQQSNYYLLDTELLFSAPESNQSAFMFSKKQRLKPGVVYYFDHPQAGMLIKVHPIT